MSAFLYYCRNTGLRAQGWTEIDESEWTDDRYVIVTCLACDAVHVVNPKTGKTAGEG
jgi:hypothetical protein